LIAFAQDDLAASIGRWRRPGNDEDTIQILSRYALCKLDLDLPRRYFELLLIMARMDANPRLGTTSGKPYFIAPGNRNLVAEVCGGEIRV